MSDLRDRQTRASEGGLAVAATPAQLMLLFDRLLTGGSLYPAGHVNFTMAAGNFRSAVAAAGGVFSAIEAGESLRVGSEVLGPEIRGVERVAGIMEKLGLHRIEIRPEVSEEELHRLASSLLGQRRTADAGGHLARTDFGDVSEAIKVTPRVFASRWADIGATGIGEAMDAILYRLEVAGAADWHLQDCRSTLDEIFGILTPKDLDTLLDALDPATRPQDTVGSKLPGERALELVASLRRLVGGDKALSPLAKAMWDAIDDRAADIDRSAARALIKAMAAADDPAQETVPAVDPRDLADETDYTLPLADLRRELASFEHATGEMTTSSDWEEFYVCLALMKQGGIAPGAARAMAGVHRHVEHSEEPENEPQLRRAVSTLLAADDPTVGDEVIEIITTAVRARGAAASLAFWQKICASPRPGLADAVWPHLVCELLTAQDGGRELLLALPGFVANPRAMSRPGNLERLEKLKAFGDPRGGAAFFRWPERRYFPVYAALLDTSRSMTFGTSLQAGLARSGPDPQIRALAEALGPFRHNQAALYRAWLTTAVEDGQAPPRELLDLLRRKVAALEPAERGESWVPETVAVIGRYSFRASRELLETIASERRLLLIPAWPLDVREAAERILKAARQHQRKKETP